MKGPGNHRAKRSLGQNFLIDPKFIARIINAVAPSPGDILIEIGPGLGALTEAFVGYGSNVIAIELDSDLTAELRSKFRDNKNFRLIESDALAIDYGRLADSRAKLAANLPYNISTAILQKLAENSQSFSHLVLMLQKEVVDRITAKPGSSARGYLTVLLESSFEATKLFDVPPEAFRPRPKVISSVVRLMPVRRDTGESEAFRRLLSVAFSQKRKTILNNLKAVFSDADLLLEEAGIDGKRRAETLSLDEWIILQKLISDRT